MTNKNDDKKTDGTKPSANVRQKAEERLKANQSKKKATLSDIETYKLIHELEVHQIELEMQQEELTLAKELAEAASAKYTNLYDFAPSGYLTLSSIGEILSLNFAAAKLLGNDRGSLINKHFSTFLSHHSKQILGSFLDALFQSQITQTTEVEIALKGMPPVYLLLTGIADDGNSFCNITLTDITERKKAEENMLLEQLDKMALINSTDDFIWSVSRDLKLIAANKPFINNIKKVTGVDLKTGDEMLLKVFPQEFLKLWQSYYNRALLGESFREETFSNYSTDNSATWIETSFNPIYHNQDIIGIACYSRNITERKNAEEEIKESEEKFRTLVQQAADGIIIVDESANYLEANESMAKLTGYSVSELKTMNGSQIVEAEDLRKNPMKKEEIKTGNPVLVERVIVKKDGTLRNVEISAKLMQKNKVICILRDTTERKKTQEKIRSSEIRLIKAQQIGKFGYWHQDINSDTVWASKEAMRIYGFEAVDGELEREKIASCIIDIEKVREAAINLVEHGKEYNIDIRINPADGSPMKYISALAELERNEKGEPVRIVGTLQDITERKKAEKTEYELHTRLKAIFEKTNDAILLADDNGKYVQVNPAAAKMLGYSQQQLTGMNAADIISGRQTDELWNEFMQDGSQTGAIELVRKDGSLVICHYNASSNILQGLHLSILTDITERKKAEQAIKESQEKFQALVTASSDIIYRISPDWTTMNELDGRGFINDIVKPNSNWLKEYTHPNDQPLLISVIKEAISATQIFELEHRVLRVDGTFGWVFSRAVPLFDAGGNIIEWFGAASDITERKKAEEELRQSESRTRKIFESDMIGFIYWDVNGEVLNANDCFLEMTGYTKQDLHDHKINWSKMTPPEYHELDRIGLVQIAATGICQSFEKEYFRKDGSRVAVLLGATVFDGTNSERGVSYIMDITERKKAQKKLRENETYLRTILDNEPECVKILNIKGELLSMNPAGLAMIEADNEQQVLGHRMTELVDKKYQLGFNRLSKAVFNGNSGTYEFEVTGLKGGHRWLETHAVPLKDAAGKITGLLGVTRDITERKKAQTELENTTQQLRQLTAHLQTIREEERKRIAREIHDELGQQLTAIKMDLAWMDKKIPADIQVAEEKIPIKSKLKNLITLIDGSNESVRKILNELRHGILEDNGLLEALEWQGNQFTEVAGIPVKFITGETALILPEQIANCLFRLYQESLTNIARHAAATKVITTLKIKHNHIMLTVEDDGKGFNIKTLESSKSFGILGMKERVFSLHGKFDLVSAKGKGTKIEISLPLNESINLKQTL